MTDVPARKTDEGSGERYGAFETGDGSVIVYDREKPTAWVQSDYAVEVGSN
ncbi:MAG: hypothetical protein ABEI96_10290 [Haloarculaceae archaeon]